MKSIPNLTFDAKGNDGKNVTTVSLLKMCLLSQPTGGFDFKTMRARLKIEASLDKVGDGGVIELEDEYHEAAIQAIKETRWISYGPHLVQFADQFGL